MALGASRSVRKIALMFSPEERERLRDDLLAAASRDPRISGGAITGSAALDKLDRWSDIDLAFGVADPAQIAGVLSDWTERMYGQHDAQHHMDVTAGSWIYRVFLLRNTLQVDLAFAPAAEFGARAPSFRLVFGAAVELPHGAPPTAESLIGWAWLYALHARSSIARGKLWQAEYMVSAMRDQVLALACLRHGLPARDGRGFDRLPAEVTRPLEGALVPRLEQGVLVRAFRVAVDALVREVSQVDRSLIRRLEPVLSDLVETLPAA
jgi:hypothetical protein